MLSVFFYRLNDYFRKIYWSGANLQHLPSNTPRVSHKPSAKTSLHMPHRNAMRASTYIKADSSKIPMHLGLCFLRKYKKYNKTDSCQMPDFQADECVHNCPMVNVAWFLECLTGRRHLATRKSHEQVDLR
jgi:hypothetical protein